VMRASAFLGLCDEVCDEVCDVTGFREGPK
jgi:hypothetical protein